MSHNKELLIKLRIERCDATIEDAKYALKDNRLFLASNRIYYAIFYIVNALAIKDDFITSKHNRLLGWSNKSYIHTGIIDQKYGQIYRKAFDKRMEGDYDDFKTFSEEEINLLYSEMKLFVEEIKTLLVNL